MRSRVWMLTVFTLGLWGATLSSVTTAYAEEDSAEEKASSDEDLRRAAQNPMADLMSFPIQNNANFGYGPLEEIQNVTNIQPVIPSGLTDEWLLISRTIVPLIHQPGFYDGQGSEFGRAISANRCSWAPPIRASSSGVRGPCSWFGLPRTVVWEPASGAQARR